jgi:hypothetical protein
MVRLWHRFRLPSYYYMMDHLKVEDEASSGIYHMKVEDKTSSGIY